MKRSELINYLNSLETKYPVDTWDFNTIKYWPVLKTMLSFMVSDRPSNVKSMQLIKRLLKKIRFELNKRNRLKAIFDIRKTHLEEVYSIFCSPLTTRVNYNQKSFSRYFDPIMDQLSKDGKKSLMFEYLSFKNSGNIYKRNRVINVSSWYSFFAKTLKNIKFNFSDSPQFELFLEDISENMGLSKQSVLLKLQKELIDIFVWSKLWDYVIKNTKPKIIFCICYYSNPGYGLMIASKNSDIPSVDMQHGGQGSLHPCYYFKNPNISKSQLLPNYFWVWDKVSQNNILNWSPCHKNGNSSVILGGNPWIDFNLSQENSLYEISESREIYLFTLQTTVYPLIPDFLIHAIKNANDDIVWWFRLHPRMTESEVNQLKNIIEKEGILSKIEINDATNLPLPLILKKVKVHISGFSGSIGEAAMVGVPLNIIIHETGRKIYEELLESDEVSYYSYDLKPDFLTFIKKEFDRKKAIAKKNYLAEDINEIIYEIIKES